MIRNINNQNIATYTFLFQIASAIKLAVPVGHHSHMPLVVIGTLSITAAGSLFLMYTVITKDILTSKKSSRE